MHVQPSQRVGDMASGTWILSAFAEGYFRGVAKNLAGTNSSLDSRVGVVLLQLGGPDSLDAIEPFLYNLFRDPDIIDFPSARLAREPLARLISTRRACPLMSTCFSAPTAFPPA
jgi:hypothetical protein